MYSYSAVCVAVYATVCLLDRLDISRVSCYETQPINTPVPPQEQ